MNVEIYPDAGRAGAAAADHLVHWLTQPDTRTLMVAGGNSPLELYRLIAERKESLDHLHVFALDEYVGVPPSDPRTTGNLLRRTVVEAWRIPLSQYYSLSSDAVAALESVREHERRIARLGGLDVIVLGLGVNGHLAFNEPGSAPDSPGRIVPLQATSVEANRAWFGGEHAPTRGVTVGLKTILEARNILLLAFGKSKARAVQAMIEGSCGEFCPASWLQRHPSTRVFLDEAAASRLARV